MKVCEVEKNCPECDGCGLVSEGFDEVKEMVRNELWMLANRKEKRPVAKEGLKYYHKLKKEWETEGMRLPCPRCDGSGVVVRKETRGEK